MSRVVKRVAMNFRWPIKKIWGGYINPFYAQKTDCPDCDHGWSPQAALMRGQWSGYGEFDPIAYGATPISPDHPALIERARRNVGIPSDVLRERARLFNLWRHSWSHHLIQADVDALVKADRLPVHLGKNPTPDQVNDWSIRDAMGHDSINEMICLRARCERDGIAVECATCKGTGMMWPTPEIEARWKRWKKTHPPAGDGWQMWETTSEGSPISPVMESAEALATWLADNGASAVGDRTASRGEWLAMILGGRPTVSQVVVDGEWISGVEAEGRRVGAAIVEPIVRLLGEEDA